VHEGERSIRLKQGLLGLAIVALIAGLVLGLKGSRFLLLLSLPFWFMFFDGIITFETGVCVKSAFKSQCLIKKTGAMTQLECPVARKMLKTAALRTLKRIIIMTLIMTGLTFALSYIIEAGTGVAMYD